MLIKSMIKKCSSIVLVTLLVLTGCNQPTNVEEEETLPDKDPEEVLAKHNQPIDGQYIVVFKEPADRAKRAKAAEQNIRQITDAYGISEGSVRSEYKYSISGFTAKLDNEQLSKVRQDDRVAYVEQDKIVMLSPPTTQDTFWCIYFGIGCDTGGGDPQVTPYGITRVGGAADGSGLTAWVIDSGVDLDHADLNVDTQRSTSFVTTESTADDGNGHGTHVAGTIAALDNDIDVVGVAAGATIVGVKVLDSSGNGTVSGVVDGIDYVAANASAGDAANMSLGGGTSQVIDDAVENAADAGVLFAVAAGNDGDDANNYSPARVEYGNVWTVSAIDDNDQFASFSNYGNPPVEYAEPGVDIESLWKNNGVNTISGTSMATPHLAGVLLVTGGNPVTDGYASGDPDGNADPIGTH